MEMSLNWTRGIHVHVHVCIGQCGGVTELDKYCRYMYMYMYM